MDVVNKVIEKGNDPCVLLCDCGVQSPGDRVDVDHGPMINLSLGSGQLFCQFCYHRDMTQ